LLLFLCYSVKSFFEVLDLYLCYGKETKTQFRGIIKGTEKIHVPQAYLAHFDPVEVKDKPDCYELVLHEKEDQVPEVLKGK